MFDLITTRSGVYQQAASPGDALEFAPKRGSRKPGSYWLYCSWDFNAARAVFGQQTGEDIYDALGDDLEGTVGMQDFDRQRQKKYLSAKRSQYPAYPMWLSAQDLAQRHVSIGEFTSAGSWILHECRGCILLRWQPKAVQ
jgi:CubicO group peptidase (beta-lactamase class C family)